MLKPSADLIIDPKQSRYSLVVGVAKRARQIVEEAEKNGEILIEKPVDLAVHDFMDEKYQLVENPVVEDDEDGASAACGQQDAVLTEESGDPAGEAEDIVLE